MDQISCGLGTKNELGKLKGVNGSSDCLSSMPSVASTPSASPAPLGGAARARAPGAGGGGGGGGGGGNTHIAGAGQPMRPQSNSAPPKPGGMNASSTSMNASSTTAKQMSEAQARGLEQELGLGGGVAGGAR